MKRLKSFTYFEAFFGLRLRFKAVCWEVWSPSSNFPFRFPLVSKLVVLFLYDDCGVCGQCEVGEQCWDQVSMWDQSHSDASLTLECWVMSSIAGFSLFLEPKVCFGEIHQLFFSLVLHPNLLGSTCPGWCGHHRNLCPSSTPRQCVQSPFPVTKQFSSVFQMV